MRARRAVAVALLSLLAGGALATGVAAQPGCAAVVRRDDWEHIRLPSFATGPAAMSQYAVDPADPARLYATNGVSVAVSGDGGCSWKTTFRLDEPPDGADYSAADAAIVDLTAAPGHALLAISQGDGSRPHVVLSSYAGETWRRGDDGLRTVLGRPLAVAMTRSNPGYAYLLVDERAGAGGAAVSFRDTVFESTTAGGAWGVRGDAGLPEPAVEVAPVGDALGRTNVTGIVADPVEAGRLFLYGPDGLYSHQQGRRVQLMGDAVSSVLVMRRPGSPGPTVVAATSGARTVEVSAPGGTSFSSFRAPGEVDSFAEGLRPNEFYVAAGGRVLLRSNGRLTEIEGGRGVSSLQSSLSQRQVSPVQVDSVLTLYGRTANAIVRRAEARRVDLVPAPESVTVGNLMPFGPLDPDQALPGSLSPEEAEVVLAEGEKATLSYELYVPETPTPLDVFFDVDTTRSMLPAIDGLRASMANIVAELTQAHIDVWFGVGQYRGFETDPAFELLQDINPPGDDLAAALNELQEGDGATETQLESLRQIATGEGSIVGVGIEPGQDATWRKGSLRIVVDITDEPISEGSPHPTYETVASAMLADDTVHFGVAVQNEATADALGPPLPGLIRIARETRSFAPAEGVDCDGDGDPDLYQGEPLVCVIDHARSRDAGVLGAAIISVLRSLRDVGEVEIAATVDEPATAIPTTPVVSGVDFKANNRIGFELELACPALDRTRRFPVEVKASRESGALAEAAVLLTCKAKPEPAPDPIPPIVPPALVVAAVPPPPPPPVNPGPHPNPNPNPQAQPQPNPQPQSQSQPQGAVAAQRQTQPQLATVQQRAVDFRPAEAGRGATEEYALSSYTPPRGPNGAMLGLAAALVIAFGSALLAAQRVELRLARQRSFKLANDLRRRR